MNFTILRFDSLESTNTEALAQARAGADEGVCIIARRQSAGRGRHGRFWASPEGSGLYFSIILRPALEPKSLTLITLMTGVAVYDTLTEFGLGPDIKWVNDVLVNEKKICGILAETTDTSKGLAVIVGIGINLTSGNFPDEIAGTATSFSQETGRKVNADELAETLTKFFGYFYGILSGETGPVDICKEWQRRSSYFTGKSVRVVLENETVMGMTDGIEVNGALRIRKNDGSTVIVQAGDIEQLRAT